MERNQDVCAPLQRLRSPPRTHSRALPPLRPHPLHHVPRHLGLLADELGRVFIAQAGDVVVRHAGLGEKDVRGDGEEKTLHKVRRHGQRHASVGRRPQAASTSSASYTSAAVMVPREVRA